MLGDIMRFIFSTFLCFALISYGEIKLEEIPRLNTTTALKILSACHQESVDQKVEVAIVIVGIDGRILASSKSEKMDPGLYDFAKFKAETSNFKGVATEDLPARNGRDLEIMDIGSLKVIRGVQGGIPLYYQGHVVGAIGVSGAKPEIDKAIAVKGIEDLKELKAHK
ncbi:MAG: GlcG/HbpS family heme-binding protein [Opitutales bacterium]|jgi:glc operon protein GlcG